MSASYRKLFCTILNDTFCANIQFFEEEAQEWAEKHLSADGYIAVFGTPEEDGSIESLNVRISSARMTKLRQAASREGMSLVALVEKLIDNL